MALVLAMLLDAALGEPRALWSRWPHPAVLMGRVVAALEARLNHGNQRRAQGILAVLLLVTAAGLTGWLIALVPWQIGSVLVGAMLIAQKSLVDHVLRVADALDLSTGDGRRAVAMIVGRDTARLDRAGVARAAIESGAENLSDGVVAPVFWFAVAGLPGLVIYKAVNTADSMIGHRTPRFEAFGWAAARLDDLLNLIPARLTAGLIWLTSPGIWQKPVWRAIRRDARLHRSPNAGWPEAALAQALDLALAGPRSYHGHMQDFPHVHPTGRRDIGPIEIRLAAQHLWRVWGVLLAAAVLLALV